MYFTFQRMHIQKDAAKYIIRTSYNSYEFYANRFHAYDTNLNSKLHLKNQTCIFMKRMKHK